MLRVTLFFSRSGLGRFYTVGKRTRGIYDSTAPGWNRTIKIRECNQQYTNYQEPHDISLLRLILVFYQ